MISFTSRDARNQFGDVIDLSRSEPVTITKHGHRVALIVSARDFDEMAAIKLLYDRKTIADNINLLLDEAEKLAPEKVDKLIARTPHLMRKFG